ncbi:hypothetical protein MMC30_001990 [Trapelia coarctata]|nr:hypothetical protein [Trapelia coarctata]
MSACSDLQDQQSATSILTAYCADKGFTSIILPSIFNTGASTVTATVTATAFTATATIIQYKSQASRVDPPALPYRKIGAALVALLLLPCFSVVVHYLPVLIPLSQRALRTKLDGGVGTDSIPSDPYSNFNPSAIIAAIYLQLSTFNLTIGKSFTGKQPQSDSVQPQHKSALDDERSGFDRH